MPVNPFCVYAVKDVTELPGLAPSVILPHEKLPNSSLTPTPDRELKLETLVVTLATYVLAIPGTEVCATETAATSYTLSRKVVPIPNTDLF